uniref:Uncharacterized protein n=1 Tax=viral metagenome TaxID=1070528 RepID=A0A6C0KFM0_9ZZZZ
MPNYFVGSKKSVTKKPAKKTAKKVSEPGAPSAKSLVRSLNSIRGASEVCASKLEQKMSEIQGLESKLGSIQSKSDECAAKLSSSENLSAQRVKTLEGTVDKLEKELSVVKKESESCLKKEAEIKKVDQRRDEELQQKKYQDLVERETFGKDSKEIAEIKKNLWNKWHGKVPIKTKVDSDDTYSDDLSSLFGPGVRTLKSAEKPGFTKQQQAEIKRQKEAREAYKKKAGLDKPNRDEYQSLLNTDDGWTGDSASWGFRSRSAKRSSKKTRVAKKARSAKSRSAKRSAKKVRSAKKPRSAKRSAKKTRSAKPRSAKRSAKKARSAKPRSAKRSAKKARSAKSRSAKRSTKKARSAKPRSAKRSVKKSRSAKRSRKH